MFIQYEQAWAECDAPREAEGKPGPVNDVVLSWATFTRAADESGMSRRYGGIHFEDADVEGRLLGRRVATPVLGQAQAFISGANVTNPSAPKLAEGEPCDSRILTARSSAWDAALSAQ